MQQLRVALESIAVIRKACVDAQPTAIRELGLRLDPCQELHDRIFREITPDPPIMSGKPGIIANGVNEELDELRRISTTGKDYLLQIQQRESEATGIPSLKIGYNNVFGYYIEVRNTYKGQVPDEWIRKQTLAQAERYITQELKEYEEKILGAESRILILESQIYAQLLHDALQYIAPCSAMPLRCLRSTASFRSPSLPPSTAISVRLSTTPWRSTFAVAVIQ